MEVICLSQGREQPEERLIHMEDTRLLQEPLLRDQGRLTTMDSTSLLQDQLQELLLTTVST